MGLAAGAQCTSLQRAPGELIGDAALVLSLCRCSPRTAIVASRACNRAHRCGLRIRAICRRLCALAHLALPPSVRSRPFPVPRLAHLCAPAYRRATACCVRSSLQRQSPWCFDPPQHEILMPPIRVDAISGSGNGAVFVTGATELPRPKARRHHLLHALSHKDRQRLMARCECVDMVFGASLL